MADLKGNGESSSSASESPESLHKSRILHDSTANPSEVKDYSRVYSVSPKRRSDDTTELGGWLVFRPYSQLDETWHMIRKEVECGVLTECTLGALSTTQFYDPSSSGPGPRTSGVIGVETTEEDIDRAGFLLIKLLKHDIKYKTNEATYNGKYVWRGERTESVCLKTLYWNNGKPSFELEGEQCRGPRCYTIKDKWHCNYVTAPESIMSTDIAYGRWVVAPDWYNLTGMWHFLKRMIESEKLGPVEMVCPPKINRRDPNEEPVFLVYTGYKNKEFVGLTIATLVEKDIAYELRNDAIKSSDSKVLYNHRIAWNDGNPVYIMTLVKPKARQYYRQTKY